MTSDLREIYQYKGAVDFCGFLRGKVDATALWKAWEEYNTKPLVAKEHAGGGI